MNKFVLWHNAFKQKIFKKQEKNNLDATHKELVTAKTRIKYLGIIILLCFSIVALRMLYIIIKYDYNSSVVRNNNLIKRHDILDRNGNVLALNVPSTSIYLRPNQIQDKDLAIAAITNALGFSKEAAEKLVNAKANFVWVKRSVTKEEELNLRYYGVIGMHFQKEQKRYYPYNNLFAHSVGMVDVDNNGISGIENSFNAALAEDNVELSLDLRLQNILHAALSKAYQNNQAKAAYGLIVDIQSNEVVAMVSLPDYNPNNRNTLSNTNMFNYATQGLFEPGSIAKPLAIAIALDSNYKVNTTIDVSKPIVSSGFVIVDFAYMDRIITMPEILMYSSNIGTSILMANVGSSRQIQYLESFRYFNPTTLELPEREKSLLPKSWDTLTAMTVSYGYGVAMSPATFMNAFVSVINGGLWSPLTLLKHNEDKEEKSTKIRVISEDASRKLRAMLRLTVSNGSGRRANVDGYSVAGKTGSAEKIVGNKYNTNSVIASFVGFFPAHAPKYAVLVSVDEPKRVAYNNYNITGGILSAPLVQEIIENMAIVLGIAKSDDGLSKIANTSKDFIVSYVENAD